MMDSLLKTAQAYINLGNVHFAKGQIKTAIEDYNMALMYDPKSSVARTNLGVSNMKLLRYEEALIEFEEAKKLDPANTRALKYIDELKSKLIKEEQTRKKEKNKIQPNGPKGSIFSKLKNFVSKGH